MSICKRGVDEKCFVPQPSFSEASRCLSANSRQFPMYVIHAENLLQMERMKPHQELLADCLLEKHDMSSQTTSVTFVSHEWSSVAHPDPHGVQLLALKDMIVGLRDGSCELHYDMVNFFRPQMCRPVNIKELKALARGYFWIDYLSIPQVCCCSEAEERQVQADMRAAVMSLHTYVAHCSFFVILAPIHYHESGRLMSRCSWKSRGWCQFELAVNGLLGSGTKPTLHVDGRALWHVNYFSFWQLSPCCGDFTKDEDRYFIADALHQVMEHMEASLRSSDNVHRILLLQNVRKELLKCNGLMLSVSARSAHKHLKEKLPSGGEFWTSLHYAAALDDVELVRTLLKANADVKARTKVKDVDFFLPSGQTPLHVWAAFSGDVSVAKCLLQHRAQVDEEDSDGITPLMISCQMGNQQSCRTLLRMEADPNVRDQYSMTPIFVAVGCDHPEIIHPLLDYEADPHVKWAGVGLLHCAAGHCTALPWDCVQRLLKEGLELNGPCTIRIFSKMGLVLAFRALLHKQLRDLFALVQGVPPLLLTTVRGNVGALQTLVRARADLQCDRTFSSVQDILQRSCIPERIFYTLLHEPAD